MSDPSAATTGTAGLSFARRVEEITVQTDLLRATLAGRDTTDMTVAVPSCPGWNVGQLVRHLGGAHRWMAGMVAAGSTEAHPDEHFRDLSGYAHEDPVVLDPWLAQGAALLTGALREAGPDSGVWVPLEGLGSPMRFSARRMTHETVIHRSDATLALGAPYTVEPVVAVDGMDESTAAARPGATTWRCGATRGCWTSGWTGSASAERPASPAPRIRLRLLRQLQEGSSAGCLGDVDPFGGYEFGVVVAYAHCPAGVVDHAVMHQA